MRSFGIFVIILDLVASAANVLGWWVDGDTRNLLLAFLLMVIALFTAAQVRDSA
jgi:hypothetical protein